MRGSRTGIFFNNIMDDFSTPGKTNFYGFPPSRANFIHPWKRPMSSMCPSVILNRQGAALLVTGASGGGRITTTVSAVSYIYLFKGKITLREYSLTVISNCHLFVQMTMNNLWFNTSLGDSVDQLRLHHQLVPNKVYHERNYPQVRQDMSISQTPSVGHSQNMLSLSRT